jgi:dipeptidase E
VSRRLLLLSNSRNYGGKFLGHVEADIRDFFGDTKEILFVPYAGVTLAWDLYAEKVAERFDELGYAIRSIHHESDARAAVKNATAIAVGGGNTFHLLKTMYDEGIVELIRERVLGGMPYIGWSAGSNAACMTIRTTNDMPIVEPPSFDAIGAVPFQINPHFTDAVLSNHGGETRSDRLHEFITSNPGVNVVGLREGSLLRVEGDKVSLLGDKDARLFKSGADDQDAVPGSSLDFLMT